jgi:hypothetical protein
MIYKSFALF